jgi:hypothetical protein
VRRGTAWSPRRTREDNIKIGIKETLRKRMYRCTEEMVKWWDLLSAVLNMGFQKGGEVPDKLRNHQFLKYDSILWS